jgi:hypothetical protein
MCGYRRGSARPRYLHRMNPASQLAWALVLVIIAGAVLVLGRLALIEIKFFLKLMSLRLTTAAKKLVLEVKVRQMARQLGCSRTSVYRLIDSPDFDERVAGLQSAIDQKRQAVQSAS